MTRLQHAAAILAKRATLPRSSIRLIGVTLFDGRVARFGNTNIITVPRGRKAARPSILHAADGYRAATGRRHRRLDRYAIAFRQRERSCNASLPPCRMRKELGAEDYVILMEAIARSQPTHSELSRNPRGVSDCS